MADTAPRDPNRIPALLATSSVDGVSTIKVYVNPTTHRLLTENAVLSGSGAPATTPEALGRIYVDSSGAKVYISTGTASSADWSIVN